MAFCFVLCRLTSEILWRDRGTRGCLRIPRQLKRMAFWSLFAVVLSCYVVRTRRRTLDWQTEESLFTAAYDVCPRSIKVLVNYGTLHRRHNNFTGALALYEPWVQLASTTSAVNHLFSFFVFLCPGTIEQMILTLNFAMYTTGLR